MKQNKSYQKACQRAEKPDELTMIALDHPDFGKRLIDEFKKLKRKLSCPQQK